MKILINDKICGKHNLINYMENSLGAPYQDDNWDGFRDCLLDLSWVSDTNVEITHESLPVLDQSDLLRYLNLLYETEMSWRLDSEKNFSVAFPENQIQEISDIIQSENMALFNRLTGSKLYQIQLGYGEDDRLAKVYFQFDGLCFFLDRSLRLDYYSLSIYQISDVLEERLIIPYSDGGIKSVKTLREEASDWHFHECKRNIGKDGQKQIIIRFKNKRIFGEDVVCSLDSNQVFHCYINNKEYKI